MPAHQRSIDACADVAVRRQIAEAREHDPVTDQEGRGDPSENRRPARPPIEERRGEVAEADSLENARHPPGAWVEVWKPLQRQAKTDDEEPALDDPCRTRRQRLKRE